MKRINYYLMLASLASLGLAACSSDSPDVASIKDRVDLERQVFVNVTIHGGSPTGSRADDPVSGSIFENGDDNESSISSVYLVFYDEKGNAVGEVLPVNPDFKDSATDAGTIEKSASEVVALTLAVGQASPTQVMCYINPVNPATLKNPLSTLQTLTRTDVVNSDGSFPMSNSVYYDDKDNLVAATPISKDNIFDTMDAAADALQKGNVADIYVERYAVKLKTILDGGGIEPYNTATMPDVAPGTGTQIPVSLTFEQLAWDVNGVANNTYVIKSYRMASTEGLILPETFSYDILNGIINAVTVPYGGVPSFDSPLPALSSTGGAWTWNAADDHRSYWACSPVYFQESYPVVGADYVASEMNQTFVSWNEVKNSNKQFGGTYYFRETTSGIPALISENPAAAIPTVMITGTYTMTVNGSAQANPQTFYTYVPVTVTVDGKEESRPSVYFQEVEGSNVAASALGEGTMSMKKRLLWQASVFYKKNADNTYERYSVANAGDLQTLAAVTELARPSDDVLGEGFKMAERIRTLQFKSNANLTGIYINDAGTPKQIVETVTDDDTEVSIIEANQILWQNVGTCSIYTNGAAFFSIPVKHLGWYRAGNEQKDADQIDYSKVRVGDLGMVRNHSYTIQVNNITGLATGVGGLDNPLVPPADTRDVYVSYRVNVLPWAIVPTQQVILK